MAHELKHYLTDRALSVSYLRRVEPINQSNPIEIGAEIFAAELIYPDQDLLPTRPDWACKRGTCTPELLVRLKHDTQTTLSYAGLAKRSEFMGFSDARAKWKKLEEQIYGPPIYTFRRARRR